MGKYPYQQLPMASKHFHFFIISAFHPLTLLLLEKGALIEPYFAYKPISAPFSSSLQICSHNTISVPPFATNFSPTGGALQIFQSPKKAGHYKFIESPKKRLTTNNLTGYLNTARHSLRTHTRRSIPRNSFPRNRGIPSTNPRLNRSTYFLVHLLIHIHTFFFSPYLNREDLPL